MELLFRDASYLDSGWAHRESQNNTLPRTCMQHCVNTRKAHACMCQKMRRRSLASDACAVLQPQKRLRNLRPVRTLILIQYSTFQSPDLVEGTHSNQSEHPGVHAKVLQNAKTMQVSHGSLTDKSSVKPQAKVGEAHQHNLSEDPLLLLNMAGLRSMVPLWSTKASNYA